MSITDFYKYLLLDTLFDFTVMLKISLFENLLTPEQQISLCIFYNDFQREKNFKM